MRNVVLLLLAALAAGGAVAVGCYDAHKPDPYFPNDPTCAPGGPDCPDPLCPPGTLDCARRRRDAGRD